MKEQIKELRVKIDGLSQLVKELRPHGNSLNWRAFHSRETEQAYDSLILAKAWLGKLLGELGAENPYGSNYKTVEDIVPTADKANITSTGCIIIDKSNGEPNDLTWLQKSHIEKVDWLRQEIESIISNIPTATVYNATREWNIARTNTYNHLCEARFWLGFELQKIKESN